MSDMTNELKTQGLQQNQSFTVRDALSNAWKMVSGSKGSYWGGFIFVVAVTFVWAFASSMLTQNLSSGETPWVWSLVWSIVDLVMQQALTVPMWAGIVLMGVRRARGEAIRSTMVFEGFKRFASLLVVTFLVVIIITVGTLFLIIPGIYLSIVYIFAVPLVLDKGMGPWEAMELSRKTVTKRWFAYFSTLLVAGIIMMASFIPLGLGLIWTLPMFYCLLGFLYVDAFGDTD